MGVSDKPSKAKKGNATINKPGEKKAKNIFRFMKAHARSQEHISQEGNDRWKKFDASMTESNARIQKTKWNCALDNTVYHKYRQTLSDDGQRNAMVAAALARQGNPRSAIKKSSSVHPPLKRAAHPPSLPLKKPPPSPLNKSTPSSPPTPNDESSNFIPVAFHDNNSSSPSTPISSKTDDDASSSLEIPSREETFFKTNEFEERIKKEDKLRIIREKRRRTTRKNKRIKTSRKHQIRLKRKRYDPYYCSSDNSDDWSITANEKYLGMGSSSTKRKGMLQ